jgi:hypothetical protein
LRFNTTGDGNSAAGTFALKRNTTGISNTGMGAASLSRNTSGSGNTATGVNCLNRNQTGSYNTALGYGALFPGGNTIFTTGDYNVVLGAFAGQNLRTGSNNIYLDNEGVMTESDTIRIGGAVGGFAAHASQAATYVAGIFGAGTDVAGVPVYVDANGKLGTMPSSQRFKENIAPMDKASEAILSLRPVTFRYTKGLTKNGAPQFGLVAEEVAKANADLVVRDAKGEIYSVRYEAVNAMLLNEFLKEHKRVEEQSVQINQLKSALVKQADEIRAVNARIDRAVPTQVADRD